MTKTTTLQEVKSLELNEQNLARINELWMLHSLENAGKCSIALLDARFISPEDFDGEQLRLLLTFGNNPFPSRRTPYVFGLHVTGTIDAKLHLYDSWRAGVEYADDGDLLRASNRGRDILCALTTDEYRQKVSEWPNSNEEVKCGLAMEPIVQDI